MIKIIILSLFLLSVSVALAQSIAVAVPSCDGPCVEGTLMKWEVSITNKESEDISFTQLEIVERNSKKTFMRTSNFNQTISPSETQTFVFDSIVPPPSLYSTLQYKECFYIGGERLCNEELSSIPVFSLQATECIDNIRCDYDQKCQDLKCIKYDCDGEYFNHTCIEKEKEFNPNILIFAVLFLIVIFNFILLMKLKKK